MPLKFTSKPVRTGGSSRLRACRLFGAVGLGRRGRRSRRGAAAGRLMPARWTLLALAGLMVCGAPGFARAEAQRPDCRGPNVWSAAAAYNAASEANLIVSLFGVPEIGWEVYAPRAQRTLATLCAPEDPGFAEALAGFKAAHALTPDGAMTAETMQVFKGVWQEARPFVMTRLTGRCPPGASPAALEALVPSEVFGDKSVVMRRDALAALRRLRGAARAEVPDLFADPTMLTVFSAYRSPASDAERCRLEGNCQGRSRAECSAHRTGLAVDLQVGEQPGRLADDAAPQNRLFQSRSRAYLWLLTNAGRFGFVNYAYEPWHWEWAPGDF